MAASIVPAGEEASTTTTRRRLTSTVWDNYTVNRPGDGGAPTATCLECGLTLCAGGKNGTSHLRRNTESKKCQQLAAELGRRQPTWPPTAAAAEPSSPPGNDDNGDYYSPTPSPPVFVVEDLFTLDGMYIPELYDKLIAEGLDNIERSNVPAVAQAPSFSTRWFTNKNKERKVRKAENKKRCAPEDESGLHVSAQPDFNLRGKRAQVYVGCQFGLRVGDGTAGATVTIQDQETIRSHHSSNKQ